MINDLTRKLVRRTQVALALVLGLGVVAAPVYADTISAPTKAPSNSNPIIGSGASFPAPVYAKWADLFAREHATLINYQSIGSGGGVRQIKANLVDFGATDYPLSTKELEQYNLLQFPTLGGGIVLAINLRELNGKLVLDGHTVADIYLGKITKWNDARIQALNPNLQLPDMYIAVLFRSDGSGTTYNFSNYLSQVSPEFKEKLGVGKAINFPVGLGGKGNEGVAAVLPRVYGSIGYMEYGYAKTMKMGVAKLKNKFGNIIEPTEESFNAAIAAADWSTSLTPNVNNVDSEKAWPINAITYVLINKNTPRLAQLEQFFKFGMLTQQVQTSALLYTPFSTEVANYILNNPETFGNKK